MEGEFGEFRESDKSLKYELKDPISNPYLAGAVVVYCCLTQEVAGFLLLNLMNPVKTFGASVEYLPLSSSTFQ